MRESGHLEVVTAEAEELRLPLRDTAPDTQPLRSSAAALARSLAWAPGRRQSGAFSDRCQTLSRVFKPLLAAPESQPEKSVSGDFRLLHKTTFLLEAELAAAHATFNLPTDLPQARARNGAVVPRIAALAEDYLATAEYRFSEASFTNYVQGFQEVAVLKMAELWALIPVLKLVLLEQIAERGRRLLQDPTGSYSVRDQIRSLQDIRQTSWKVVIEPLIMFDHVLREDPAGAYSLMDYDSRDLYRKKLVNIAERSDCTEMEVASTVLALARQAQNEANDDPRVTLRASHVGSYLPARHRRTHLRDCFGGCISFDVSRDFAGVGAGFDSRCVVAEFTKRRSNHELRGDAVAACADSTQVGFF